MLTQCSGVPCIHTGESDKTSLWTRDRREKRGPVRGGVPGRGVRPRRSVICHTGQRITQLSSLQAPSLPGNPHLPIHSLLPSSPSTTPILCTARYPSFPLVPFLTHSPRNLPSSLHGPAKRPLPILFFIYRWRSSLSSRAGPP